MCGSNTVVYASAITSFTFVLWSVLNLVIMSYLLLYIMSPRMRNFVKWKQKQLFVVGQLFESLAGINTGTPWHPNTTQRVFCLIRHGKKTLMACSWSAWVLQCLFEKHFFSQMYWITPSFVFRVKICSFVKLPRSMEHGGPKSVFVLLFNFQNKLSTFWKSILIWFLLLLPSLF